MSNPLKQLGTLGQSVWLDYIRRDLISSGELRRMIDEEGLTGLTSNPSIFEKAFAGSPEYDDEIQTLALQEESAQSVYEALSQRDVRQAADEFRSLYDRTEGKEGYVSLEVNPHLANDTAATIEEARRLWAALDRPNVFIKVPGTREGLPAIQQLISEGININVTLLFGLPRYRQVTAAYLSGLEKRAQHGKSIGAIASVASFFVSRVDALVDPILEKHISKDDQKSDLARKLRGEVAIANARIAYQIYLEIFQGEQYRNLARHGAHPQRLLWASTSTKNPDYPDVKYVEALIGPQTINTLPLETFEAYRDHGRPEARLEQDLELARWRLQKLPELGIDLDQVTDQLENDGIQKFKKPFTQMLDALSQKMERVRVESAK